ncbi:MAG TPA: hypothetical protein VNA86_04690, partial [bacterium]|nr:hypothetical protein [bacterium]
DLLTPSPAPPFKSDFFRLKRRYVWRPRFVWSQLNENSAPGGGEFLLGRKNVHGDFAPDIPGHDQAFCHRLGVSNARRQGNQPAVS